MPKTRFLIACEPRTGSNWLCALLQSHPKVLCHHEVFHKDEIYYAVGHRDGRLAQLGTTAERDRDPKAFLERLWRADFGRDAVGVKILAGQVPGLLAELLGETGLKKIILRRRSRLRAYVSLLRARETGYWARTSYDGLAVEVEAQAFADFARRYDAFYAGLRSATRSQHAVEVVYEDLQRDPREVERVLDFLDVDSGAAELHSITARQSHDSLREAIRNHEELADCLRGTEWESELAEHGPAQQADRSV